MARKQLWLVTVEQGEKITGWTEKNFFTASEEITKLKGCPDSKGADFLIFRLTLKKGKIYANRIPLGKEKENEVPKISDLGTKLMSIGLGFNGSGSPNNAVAEGSGLTLPS